jgi:ABC-2 type transport system permease protein
MLKPLAFLKRDFLLQVSYRFAFLLQFFGIFLQVSIFYFLSKLLGKGTVPYLEPYGGDFFAFVLVGIAFYNYMSISMNTFSGSIRREQMLGILESILSTPTRLSTIVLSSGLWSFLFTSFRVVIYFVVGLSIYGLKVTNINFLSALVVLTLSIAAFIPVGIISASFIMIFKRGDPIAFVFSSGSALLGGVYYPIEILPMWLKKVAYFLPITHSLQAMRLAILQGYSLPQLETQILALLLFSFVLLPLSVGVFSYAVKRAKIEGSLTQY